MPITRRQFIRIGAASVGTAAVGGGLVSNWYGLDAPRPTDPRTDGDRIVPTTCEMCFWRCGVLAHVRDGRVTKLAGNPAHPLSRGRLCPRGAGGPMQPIAESVSADEVARLLVEGNATWTIVVVRVAGAFAKGSVPGSMNVFASELSTESAWNELFAPGDEVLVVGETAAPAALRAPRTVRVAALRGGFAAWSREVLAPPPPPGVGDAELAAYNERAAIAAYLSGAPTAAPVARPQTPATARPAAPKKAGGGC